MLKKLFGRVLGWLLVTIGLSLVIYGAVTADWLFLSIGIISLAKGAIVISVFYGFPIFRIGTFKKKA